MESTTKLLRWVKFQLFIALRDYIFVIGFGLLQSGLVAYRSFVPVHCSDVLDFRPNDDCVAM